jgi:cardiolipin synthase
VITTTAVGIGGLWAAAALTLITGYDYLRAGIGHMGADDAPKRPTDAGAGPQTLERADPARDTGRF